MAVDFHGHPMLPATGFNAPTRFEADIYDCEVWGKVPTGHAPLDAVDPVASHWVG